MVSTISRRERIHQTTLNCNITPNISSILQRLFPGGITEAVRQHAVRCWEAPKQPVVTAHQAVGASFHTHLKLWQEGHSPVSHGHLQHRQSPKHCLRVKHKDKRCNNINICRKTKLRAARCGMTAATSTPRFFNSLHMMYYTYMPKPFQPL